MIPYTAGAYRHRPVRPCRARRRRPQLPRSVWRPQACAQHQACAMGAGGAMRLLALVLLAADISEQKMSQQQRESVTQQAHFKLLRRHLDVPSHQPFGFSSGLALEAEAPQPLPPEPAWVAAQLLMDHLDGEDDNEAGEAEDNEAGDMVKHVRAKQEKRRKASRREVSDKMAPWRGPYGKLIDFMDI